MKKVLGWLLFAVLIGAAVFWWFWRIARLEKQREKLRTERKALRRDHEEKVQAIKVTEESTVTKINVDAAEKRHAIDVKEAEINKAAKAGPTEIARLWTKHLLEKKA